jgi:hypothetical protein
MVVRGWVYVMTNLAMPGLVKVGFSTKDPQLRAKELDGTGLPHPFIVAYDALLEEPRQVEIGVHRELGRHREAKEFFRVSVDVAVHAVKRVLAQQGKSVLLSSVKHQEACVDGANSTTLRKATLTRRPTSAEGRTGTARFVGKCGYCGSEFAVTLTRHDSGAVCPSCYKRNDVSDFTRIAFSV